MVSRHPKVPLVLASAVCILSMTACGTAGPQGGDGARSAVPSTATSEDVSASPPSLESEEGVEAEAPTSGSVATAAGRRFTSPEGITIVFVGAKLYSGDQVEKIIPGSYNVEKGDGPDV